MKTTTKITVWLLLISCCRAETIYFSGGQSNADLPWRAGIESVLGPVVWNHHSGANMFGWVDNSGNRNPNYLDDLALVTAAMQPGDTFGGLLWFQGEGDASFAVTYQHWGWKFAAMLDFYRQDLGVKTFDVVVTRIDLESPPNVLWLDTVRADQSIYSNVDSRGFRRTDGVHVTSLAARTLGKQAAKIIRPFGPAYVVPETSCASWITFLLALAITRFQGVVA